MTSPRSLLVAALRILESAERDAERGLHMSACVSAQRAAAMATETWLRESGQSIVSSSVHENVCLSPDAGEAVREAGRLLDRHRIEEGPHGSVTSVGDSARESEAALGAGRTVVDFVATRLGIEGATIPPAARGPTEVFGPLAGDYASFRPGYPDALFDALFARIEGRPGPILDLGSGTGAAVAPLLERGARVVAIEPNRSMLEQARSRLGDREGWLGAIAARAEELPVASGVAAALTVAQAFHWFEARPSLDECARVLPAGGTLALLWNVTVPDAFTDEVRVAIGRYNPGYGRPVTLSMLETPAALAEHPAFSTEPPRRFPHARAMTEDAYVGYAFSWSYCGGALAAPDRGPFERELRAAIRRHHPRGRWSERLIAVAHFARRL